VVVLISDHEVWWLLLHGVAVRNSALILLPWQLTAVLFATFGHNTL
jgi:hypothetical protein